MAAASVETAPEPATTTTVPADDAPQTVPAGFAGAEAGVVLNEHEPAPEYDLSSMSLDPPGVTLAESVTITPPEFDTSNMSLDEVP